MGKVRNRREPKLNELSMKGVSSSSLLRKFIDKASAIKLRTSSKQAPQDYYQRVCSRCHDFYLTTSKRSKVCDECKKPTNRYVIKKNEYKGKEQG